MPSATKEITMYKCKTCDFRKSYRIESICNNPNDTHVQAIVECDLSPLTVYTFLASQGVPDTCLMNKIINCEQCPVMVNIIDVDDTCKEVTCTYDGYIKEYQYNSSLDAPSKCPKTLYQAPLGSTQPPVHIRDIALDTDMFANEKLYEKIAQEAYRTMDRDLLNHKIYSFLQNRLLSDASKVIRGTDFWLEHVDQQGALVKGQTKDSQPRYVYFIKNYIMRPLWQKVRRFYDIKIGRFTD